MCKRKTMWFWGVERVRERKIVRWRERKDKIKETIYWAIRLQPRETLDH